jgi:hypothetical protein
VASANIEDQNWSAPTVQHRTSPTRYYLTPPLHDPGAEHKSGGDSASEESLSSVPLFRLDLTKSEPRPICEVTVASKAVFYLKAIPDCPVLLGEYTRSEGSMAHVERNEMCACGHPQSLHRTYGCTGTRSNPDPKKTDRVWCQCKAFQAQKAAHAR